MEALVHDEVFAANRARGRIAFSVAAGPNGSRRDRVHEAGSLRVRFPNGERGGALDAVIVNTAGGMASGDRYSIDISVGPGARLNVTTAAAEKVYRSVGPDTELEIKLHVEGGGEVIWLPQETILFDEMRLSRSIAIELAADASLLLAEAVIFGRSAKGETVQQGRFFDRWRIRRGGKLIFAETISLDGDIAQQLARRAVARDGVAMAGIVKIPGGEDDVAARRGAAHDYRGEVGVSAWNGLAAARLVAPDGATLRHDLVAALAALRVPLPRLWMN
jgi:urease accessory protein